MLAVLLSLLGSVSPWFTKRQDRTDGTSWSTATPRTNRLSNTAYFAGEKLFEKVNGVWLFSGIVGTGVISEDGLTVATFSGNTVSIRKRADASTSFSTSAVVAVSVPNSTLITDITISANGNTIATVQFDSVASPIPDYYSVATAIIFNGSSWVVTVLGTLSHYEGASCHILLNQSGTRLAFLRSDGRLFTYGMPGTGYTVQDAIAPSLPYTGIGVAPLYWLTDHELLVTDFNNFYLYSGSASTNTLTRTGTLSVTTVGVTGGAILAADKQLGLLATFDLYELVLLKGDFSSMVFSKVGVEKLETVIDGARVNAVLHGMTRDLTHVLKFQTTHSPPAINATTVLFER